jgi:hypothetical protein
LWIGLRSERLDGRWAFAGVAVASALTIAGWISYQSVDGGGFALFVPPGGEESWQSLRAPLGLQAGVWALGLNFAICAIGASRRR